MRKRALGTPGTRILPDVPAEKGGTEELQWTLHIALCPFRGVLDPVLLSCSGTSALPLVPDGDDLHTGAKQDLPAQKSCSELPGRCRGDPTQSVGSSDVSSLSHGFCSAFKVLLGGFFFLGKKKSFLVVHYCMPDVEFLNYITFLRQRSEAGELETMTISVTIPAGKAPAPGADSQQHFWKFRLPFPTDPIVCTTASFRET